MTARVWFTKENTSDLATQDLAIINRAARMLIDNHRMRLTHELLTSIRMNYAVGLSANDIVWIVIENR